MYALRYIYFNFSFVLYARITPLLQFKKTTI